MVLAPATHSIDGEARIGTGIELEAFDRILDLGNKIQHCLCSPDALNLIQRHSSAVTRHTILLDALAKWNTIGKYSFTSIPQLDVGTLYLTREKYKLYH